jgi:hypothetical protein
VARTDDVETAYFALLRAREEVTSLQRWEEYLRAERARIDAFVAAGRELDETVDRRLRRSLGHNDGPLGEVLEQRRRLLADELHRLPERVEAAERFVAECEAEHDALKRRSA